MTEDDSIPQQWSSESESEGVTLISVQAFTPILGTLLLSPNGLVGGTARQAIVEVLRKIRMADEREGQGAGSQDVEGEEATGLFGSVERKIFQEEMLHQVVIGMGRLDAVDESDEVHSWGEDGENETAGQRPIAVNQEPWPKKEDVVNPYFPIMSLSSSPSSTLIEPLTPPQVHVKFAQLPDAPSHIASFRHEAKVNLSPEPKTLELDSHIPCSPSPSESSEHTPISDYATGDIEFDNEADEQAAVGRLSSMSLMAAVTANGVLVFFVHVHNVNHSHSSMQVHWRKKPRARS